MREYKRRADQRVPGVANGMAGFVTFMQVIEHELLDYGGVQGKSPAPGGGPGRQLHRLSPPLWSGTTGI